nr:ribonuclease H-like domain-containing protein [Tanacetum cinerariifolium]
MGFQNKNSLNFFNNDENESKSSEPYDDGRDNKTGISKGIDPILFEGTKNTDFIRWDEAVNPDDSDSAKAVSNIEEHAILEENDKKSEGDDSFYQKFNEMFDIPNMIPDNQSDINPKSNAFLYGDLVEDVYMSLPDGYFDKSDTRVCKQIKSLYGLKQAPRKWNEKLTLVLLENDFKQSKSDFSLFIKDKNGVFIVLLVYVDDIIITDFGMLAFKPCGTPIGSKKLTVKGNKAKSVEIDKTLTGIKNYQNDSLSWKSKKQSMLSKSSAEAEYRAINDVTCEVIWILKDIAELNIEKSLHVSLHCDNSSAIEIAANLVFHERTKHFEIELYFFKEKVSFENCKG